MRNANRRFLVVAAVVLASAAAFGVDAPDLRVNATAGLIETVDATWSGKDFNVRCTETTTLGLQLSSTVLTTNAANDIDPRVAIAPAGDVLVVWWRDLSKDALIYKKRSAATGAWGLERMAGVATESNSHPRIAYDGAKSWVAYEIQNSNSRSIGVQIIDDDPEPFRSIIATTSRVADLDVQLSVEASHLWVSWIDNSRRVGYAVYDHQKQLWSAPAYEAYLDDSVAAARSRIRGYVLGL
jgi:hypothetical protein